MTDDQVMQLAAIIGARWPYPVMSDVDLEVLAMDLADEDPEQCARAVQHLAKQGHPYQPRSPAIHGAISELAAADRRERLALEAMDRQEQRRLAPLGVAPPPEVLQQLERLRTTALDSTQPRE